MRCDVFSLLGWQTVTKRVNLSRDGVPNSLKSRYRPELEVVRSVELMDEHRSVDLVDRATLKPTIASRSGQSRVPLKSLYSVAKSAQSRQPTRGPRSSRPINSTIGKSENGMPTQQFALKSKETPLNLS